VPKHIRGRAFGINQCLQFTSVPAVALSSWLLLPIKPFGIEGWRWVALFPSIAAIFVWWIRRQVPESPRWLAQQGRIEEAKEIVATMEARVRTELGQPLPDVVLAAQEAEGRGSWAEILRPPFLRRTIMLATMNFFSGHRLLRLQQLGSRTDGFPGGQFREKFAIHLYCRLHLSLQPFGFYFYFRQN
jgi:putative MFS transporter